MVEMDRSRIKELMQAETKRFLRNHKRSKALFERARKSLLAGVPMNWMVRWAGPYPVFVKEGRGTYVTDVDGNEYLDLCLGDTGSMFGHSPKAVVDSVRRQVAKGITMMLPTEDSVWVGEELSRRFGLPYWQVAMTATDANRFVIRLAREVTKRSKIMVVNGCYHGTVDETLIVLEKGRVLPRSGNIGPPVDPSVTTKAIEFNDIDALEEALSPGDVACALMEPAMTNRGIILPDPGYHEALRKLTKKHGTLLVIDETHTICCGIGGYTREHHLKPDMITMGKPLASGVPVAAFGISQYVADRIMERILSDGTDESGLGGTLTGNALAVAAMRATLEKVITERNFAKMLPLAERFEKGVRDVIEEVGMPWHVVRLGVRIEYHNTPNPPRNGGEYDASKDHELEKLMHLMALNRGILLTPFHNMALISPSTTARDVDFHTSVFRESVKALVD
ncbi:MAG: aspartate aminotransferase family protein [Candidatus Thermoplasmatota archaeon]|nr:aspartate aminotransferase family protein [Candidatus Thermoplasmatota archaeon]